MQLNGFLTSGLLEKLLDGALGKAISQEPRTTPWGELMEPELLVAVAEEGRLQKAMTRSCRTIPVVSVALRKLEKEVGVPCLNGPRDTRVVLDRSWVISLRLRRAFAFPSG